MAEPPLAGVEVRAYALPLTRPWRMAGCTLTERRGAIVVVTDRDGIAGFGDCAPLPAMGTETEAQASKALESTAGSIPGRAAGEVLATLGLADRPAARCAIETALLDLQARRAGLPLARLLDPAAGGRVPVNAVIGGLDADCVERAAAAAAEGYGVAKLKVGLGRVEDEITQLRRLCESLGGRLRLRLDANRAWSAATAELFVAAAAELPLDGLEEPLAAPTLPALRRLQDRARFAVAVDESLTRLGTGPLLAARAVRRIVLKPVLLGGLLPACRIAREAGEAGMQVVITSAIDSAIGVTAAAHLAAALGGDIAHGLATLDWLAADLAPRPSLSGGYLDLPPGAGLGTGPTQPIAR